MPEKVHVPRPFDRIQVLFDVDNVGQVWWPGVVLTTSEPLDPGRIQGTAEIEYAARHGQKSTRGELQFFKDRIVNCDTGETKWRTEEEAADAGDGDAANCRWGPASPTPASPPFQPDTEGDDNEDEHAEEAEDDWGDRAGQVVGKKRRAPRPNTIQGRSRKARRKTGPAATATPMSPAGVKQVVQQLVCRVERLEQHTKAKECDRKNHDDLIDEIVMEKRVIWKLRLQIELDRAVKQVHPMRAGELGVSLQCNSIRITDVISYRSFARIVQDISTSVSVKELGGVRFEPSYSTLANPSMDIDAGHVIFDTAGAMMKWLGMTGMDDIHKALVKTNKKSKTVMTRVIGGVQWVEGDTSAPFRIFVGASCAAFPPHAEEVVEGSAGRGRAQAIVFPTAEVDVGNNSMSAQPSKEECKVGPLKMGDLKFASTSLFRVSWVWMKGQEGKAISAHGRRPEFVRVGNITVSVPIVVVKGNELSDTIRNMCSNAFLNLCS